MGGDNFAVRFQEDGHRKNCYLVLQNPATTNKSTNSISFNSSLLFDWLSHVKTKWINKKPDAKSFTPKWKKNVTPELAGVQAKSLKAEVSSAPQIMPCAFLLERYKLIPNKGKGHIEKRPLNTVFCEVWLAHWMKVTGIKFDRYIFFLFR